MKRRLIFAISAAMLLICLPCPAMTSDLNVKDEAIKEIHRRGKHVESTATIRANLISDAFAPPKDDSDKWFFTFVSKDRDRTSVDLAAVISGSVMQAWVDTAEPSKSTMHYCRRDWDLDGPSKDWLKGLSEAVERYGLPAIVIQPPRNGRFGDPSVIVKMIHGYHTEKELDNLVREGIKSYVTTFAQRAIDGHTEPDTPIKSTEIGVPPPFNVPPKNDNPGTPNNTPVVNPTPFDWPATTPAALTIDQVRAACPGCPSDFVLATIESNETNIDKVKLRWEVYQLKNRPVAPPAINPPQPIAPTPITPAPLPIDDEPEPVRPRLIPREDHCLNPICPALVSTPTGTLELCLVSFVIGLMFAKCLSSGVKLVADVIAKLNRPMSLQMPIDLNQLNQQQMPVQNVSQGWKPPGSNGNGSGLNG
jgi:hypothetical protein